MSHVFERFLVLFTLGVFALAGPAVASARAGPRGGLRAGGVGASPAASRGGAGPTCLPYPFYPDDPLYSGYPLPSQSSYDSQYVNADPAAVCAPARAEMMLDDRYLGKADEVMRREVPASAGRHLLGIRVGVEGAAGVVPEGLYQKAPGERAVLGRVELQGEATAEAQLDNAEQPSPAPGPGPVSPGSERQAPSPGPPPTDKATEVPIGRLEGYEQEKRKAQEIPFYDRPPGALQEDSPVASWRSGTTFVQPQVKRMRRAASVNSLSVALVALLFPSFAWGQHLALPGPGPIPPAFDSPAYLAPSNETLHPPPPRGYAIDIRQAKQDAASALEVAPAGVQYDRGASASLTLARPLSQPSLQPESNPVPPVPALVTSFTGIGYTGFLPPDPVVAAGPTNLVLVTNGSVTIKDKAGALVASTSLGAFFFSVRAANEDTFDPRVVFDTGSNRFFLSAAGQIDNPSCTAGTCVSHFFLAVSKTSSPATTGSGDWYFYAFDATLDGTTPTANWADFPGLGVDSNVVVLTANMFSFSSDTFQRAKIRILDKSVLIAGGAVTWTDFVGMHGSLDWIPLLFAPARAHVREPGDLLPRQCLQNAALLRSHRLGDREPTLFPNALGT